jgi:hypothetical protein
MLDPSVLAGALVTTLQTISPLVAMIGGKSANIQAHKYSYGVDFRLKEAIYKMVSGGILIAWRGTRGGNFTGQNIWKHSFRGVARLPNQAQAGSPVGLPDLWLQIVNGTVNSSALNIRKIQVYPGVDIMDTPSSEVIEDEDGMDFLAFEIVLPEIGDQ